MIWGWLILLQPETGLDAHASLCTAVWTPCYPVYNLLSMRGSRIFRQGGVRVNLTKKPWQRSTAYFTEVKWLKTHILWYMESLVNLLIRENLQCFQVNFNISLYWGVLQGGLTCKFDQVLSTAKNLSIGYYFAWRRFCLSIQIGKRRDLNTNYLFK